MSWHPKHKRQQSGLLVTCEGRTNHFGPDDAIVIGRDPDATITLDDNITVSRQHLRLSFEAGRWQLTDLGSKHGYRVLEGELDAGGVIDRPVRVAIGADHRSTVLAIRPHRRPRRPRNRRRVMAVALAGLLVLAVAGASAWFAPCGDCRDGERLIGVELAAGGSLVSYELDERGAITARSLDRRLEVDDSFGASDDEFIISLNDGNGSVGELMGDGDRVATTLDWDADGRPDYHHQIDMSDGEQVVLVDDADLGTLRDLVLAGGGSVCGRAGPVSERPSDGDITINCVTPQTETIGEDSSAHGLFTGAPQPTERASAEQGTELPTHNSLLSTLSVVVPEAPTALLGYSQSIDRDIELGIPRDIELGMGGDMNIEASAGQTLQLGRSVAPIRQQRRGTVNLPRPRIGSTCAFFDNDYVKISERLLAQAERDFDDHVELLDRLIDRLDDEDEWFQRLAEVFAAVDPTAGTASDLFNQVARQVRDHIAEGRSALDVVRESRRLIDLEMRTLTRDVQLAIGSGQIDRAAEFVNAQYQLWAGFVGAFSPVNLPINHQAFRDTYGHADLFALCEYMKGTWGLDLTDADPQEGIFRPTLGIEIFVAADECWSWETCTFSADISDGSPGSYGVYEFTSTGQLGFNTSGGGTLADGTGHCVGPRRADNYYDWQVTEAEISFQPLFEVNPIDIDRGESLDDIFGPISEVRIKAELTGSFERRPGARAPRGLQCEPSGLLFGRYRGP